MIAALSVLLFFGPIVVIISVIGYVELFGSTIDLRNISRLGRMILAFVGIGIWLSVYVPLIVLALNALPPIPTNTPASTPDTPTPTFTPTHTPTRIPSPTFTPTSTSTPTCPGETTFERVKCTGVVRVGVANEYPYGFIGSGNTLSGEAIEVARVIFNRLGIPEMEGVVTEFEALIPSLQAGRFDVITAGMWIRPERCEQVLFADPEYKSIVEGETLFGAAAFRKEDTELRDAFSAELQKLKNSGELENIITQYEDDVGDISLPGTVTAEELCNP